MIQDLTIKTETYTHNGVRTSAVRLNDCPHQTLTVLDADGRRIGVVNFFKGNDSLGSVDVIDTRDIQEGNRPDYRYFSTVNTWGDGDGNRLHHGSRVTTGAVSLQWES